MVSEITGFHVLTHAWLLENNGQWPIAAVGMNNDSNGGFELGGGRGKVKSVLSRIFELAVEGL